MLYSTLLNEDALEIDLASNTIKHNEDLFQELEENLDTSDPKNVEHLSLLKNKILERIKVNRERRISRRDSVSSNSSRGDSRKRDADFILGESDSSRFREDPTSSSLLQ